MIETLRKEWKRSLEKVGLSGNKAAFDVQGAAQSGSYIAKFGAAEEITLGSQKKARSGGRTPRQLLEDSATGDKKAGALYKEYALAFKGKHQLVWSNGFKDLIGLNEVSDEEASQEELFDEVIDDLIAQFTADEWRQLTRRNVCRESLLRSAETGGYSAVMEVVRTTLEGIM